MPIGESEQVINNVVNEVNNLTSALHSLLNDEVGVLRRLADCERTVLALWNDRDEEEEWDLVVSGGGDYDNLVADLRRWHDAIDDTAVFTGRVVKALERDLPKGYAWPGNVRELEQAVRRILVTGRYEPDRRAEPEPGEAGLFELLGSQPLPMSRLAGLYCEALYARYGSYEAVARHTQLDRRTVKKHLSRR